MNDPQNMRTLIDQIKKDSRNPDITNASLLSQARDLLKQAFQTEFETEVRELFRSVMNRDPSVHEISEDEPAVGGHQPPRWAEQIEMLEVQISDGFRKEVENSLSKLAMEVLPGLGSDSGELWWRIKRAFETALKRFPDMENHLLELLRAPNLHGNDDVLGYIKFREKKDDLPRGPETSSDRFIPKEPDVPTDTSAWIGNQNYSSSSDIGDEDGVTQLLAEGRRLFYAGEYMKAIDRFSEVLRLEPKNTEAQNRISQAEDNIRRGIVPDNRVPVEARIAFGRAQSLERAGRYKEARDYYEASLAEAKKAGPELAQWPPALEALLRIEQFVIAIETRDKADVHLDQDEFDLALNYYNSVLALIPDDTHTKTKIEVAHSAKKVVNQSRSRLNSLAGSLMDMGNIITQLLEDVERILQELPESRKLNNLKTDIKAKGREIKSRMVEQGQSFLIQSELDTTITERKRKIDNAVRLLDYAALIAPDETEIFENLQQATTEQSRLESAIVQLNEVRRLINNGGEDGRKQAVNILRSLREFHQDKIFQNQGQILARAYFDEIENHIRRGQRHEANKLLHMMRDDPFRSLGISNEIWDLEERVKKLQTGIRLRGIGIGGGIGIILLIILAFAWPTIMGVINPTPTATPTATATTAPTATPTPTFTPPPRLSATDTPTTTPSATPVTPTSTSTSAPGLGVISEGGYARLAPDSSAATVFYINPTELVDIIKQERDASGRLWLLIRQVRGTAILEGWILGTYVNIRSTPTP